MHIAHNETVSSPTSLLFHNTLLLLHLLCLPPPLPAPDKEHLSVACNPPHTAAGRKSVSTLDCRGGRARVQGAERQKLGCTTVTQKSKIAPITTSQKLQGRVQGATAIVYSRTDRDRL
ncbi:hypothetical protein GDO81_024049 [Engystomops pustulosus]|uniref:Secreted protein n=1 Tax=Engystomops pustulosus TaxID=76066 RepID=A0AAV6YL86_ENGPU|nr:hypothetical protein GDO81_024049 [Engystomops pustulosus]